MSKVLIMEDEESIRSFIIINLKRNGFEVLETENGEQALHMLETVPDIDIALLDVMVPGIDGFEVCRRIREKMNVLVLFSSQLRYRSRIRSMRYL